MTTVTPALPPSAPPAGAHPALMGGNRSPAAVRRAAEDFEAQFLSQMLTHVFEQIEVDPMFGGGDAEEMYRSLLVEQYGKQLVKAGGLGIADEVQKQLLSMQEM
ncbi:rod-binding protein [Arenibaculum sp.]|jgi:Rod binding domain-containing protein|uniref:rod-binding protein n=1 Tax=Arenibaculum sp. TaxID=2865862 RepID=UPI002E0F3D8E|nr:rod-binding protein [Arenibaculum sp.]